MKKITGAYSSYKWKLNIITLGNLGNDFMVLENNNFALTTLDLLCTHLLEFGIFLPWHFKSAYIVWSCNMHTGGLLSGKG